MKIRYLTAWFTMLGVAMVNGGVRDVTYGKQLPALLANQLSCLSGIILLGVVIYLYVRRWSLTSARQAFYLGLFWMALTVAFEFLFFHYVGGRSWAVLLESYDMASGQLWPLILLWILIAPYLFYRMLQKFSAHPSIHRAARGTGETTSHPTRQPKGGCQVVGYQDERKN